MNVKVTDDEVVTDVNARSKEVVELTDEVRERRRWRTIHDADDQRCRLAREFRSQEFK